MAIPYPEGEVFFKRDVLKHASGFNATDKGSFYSNILVETAWNDCLYGAQGLSTPPSKYSHSRCKAQVVNPDAYRTNFCIWPSQAVMFGPNKTGLGITHRFDLRNNVNANEIRNRDSGGPLKVVLMPVPIANEKYMFLDLTTEVRAIYFPLAYQCSEAFDDLCSYIMIDFRLRHQIDFRLHPTNAVTTVDCTNEMGLGRDNFQYTLCFDLTNLYHYLALPHQMRNPDQGLYDASVAGDELLWLLPEDQVKCEVTAEKSVAFDREMDLAKVVSANLGVNLVWAPYEYSSWVINMITEIVSFGLGCIPVIGPLLSFDFNVAIMVITNPGQFSSDAGAGGLLLGLIEAVISSGLDAKSYMAPGYNFSGGASRAESRGRPKLLEDLKAMRQRQGEKPHPLFAARLEGLEKWDGPIADTTSGDE